MSKKPENYINHIAFVVDKSGSIRMAGLERTIVDVFDQQIKHLAQRSRELNQDTRVSIYLFNETTQVVTFDLDVSKIVSLGENYRANGDTALIDATLQSIDDLQSISTKYGNHAFLIYILTDGENRINNHLSDKLNKTINSLPENWTVAALVPDQDGVFECKKFGFPKDNIKVWETSKRGVAEVGRTLAAVNDTYLTSRSTGTFKGTRALFNLDAGKLSASAVKGTLEELNADQYGMFPVHKEAVIKDFVESWTGEAYRSGSAYFQITKPETIQAHKQIAIQHKFNGRVYIGANARKMLGLPDYEIRVVPANHGGFDLFVQSTSFNRKLVAGTKLLVLK